MDFDVTIIGAGVVGLALAARLSKTIPHVLVIEREPAYGRGISSRNSEVIHGGIYYPEGSLKARLCVEGRDLLYRYCGRHRVAHKRCGKLIVATCDEEVPALEQLIANAGACGVAELQRLTGKAAQAMAPGLQAVAAVYSPSTGIVSAHGFMQRLHGQARRAGVLFSFGTEAVSVEAEPHGSRVEVSYRDGKRDAFTTGILINAAGLSSEKIAGIMGFSTEATALHWWKGEYASLDLPQGAFNTLIYPVPEPANAGLGIHTTIGLDGTVRLGPNAIYLPEKIEDYRVDPSHMKAFYRAARRYLPGIRPEMLRPDMAGIRPKRQKPGDPVRDFLIHSDPRKGHIHLIGIESPGLTASLAMAREVGDLL